MVLGENLDQERKRRKTKDKMKGKKTRSLVNGEKAVLVGSLDTK